MTVNDAAKPTTQAEEPLTPTPLAPKWFAALGLAAGFGAVVASSCCVIPLGLAAVGAGASVLGGLESVAAWRIPLLAVSVLAIVGGWGGWWWKRSSACVSGSTCASPAPSRATLTLLVCASVMVLAAASWSNIDPVLLKLVRGR